MSQLPGRPDADQLRRRARELHRAAVAGDAGALGRLREVSDKVTLSAAQLAIARDYGFPSWPRLKAEVERRRAAAGQNDQAGPAEQAPPPPVKSRDEMRADELIDAQYADRPQLRPVLDAVLAALPALGPVTVQARKTLVSLVGPRRTFAVVQATTKNRVDLGLRLDDEKPGGRLLAARDIGAANLRIPLTGPGDLDEEALGWLRRAYNENAAPPPPRRPARRPATVLGPMTVVIEGYDLPGLTCRPEPGGSGHRNVHVALSGKSKDRAALVVPDRPGLAIEPVPGDAESARWEVPVTVRRDADGLDFTGPFVGGTRDDRNLGLAWGDVPGDGTLRLFRGAKLRLVDVDPALIEEAMRPGHRLVARIRLTDPRGNPVCARVHPPALTWSVRTG
jgi:Family of unknown function (DUF5990)/Domain of unknown function (DUF5655)